MKIVVTGGLGFIGSHTVVELQNEGFEVVAIDNLSNASTDVLEGIENNIKNSISYILACFSCSTTKMNLDIADDSVKPRIVLQIKATKDKSLFGTKNTILDK